MLVNKVFWVTASGHLSRRRDAIGTEEGEVIAKLVEEMLDDLERPTARCTPRR